MSPTIEVSSACFIGEYEYCGSGADHGFSAQDLESAYKLPSATAGSGQTVAIVDAYDDPNAQADLNTYRSTYDLPPCENGCFTKVNQTGGTTYPEGNSGWSFEISLDLDMVSAACPKCHILLVEANNSTIENLGTAENEAVALGATEISNSYASREVEVGKALVEEDSSYYKHSGVPITVASGDDGYDNEQFETEECDNCSPNFPADLSTVISVGGTSLGSEGETGRGWGESVWFYSGSGCTLYMAKPTWQTDKGCANRTDNDVAAEASDTTPVSVYDTYSLVLPGWQVVGGTSVSTPLMAGTIALESSALRSEGSEGIYKYPSNWFDVTKGSNWSGLNGECSEKYLCNGEVGYDGPTGVGTPDGGATATSPSAITEPASGVTTTGGTLNAIVNPEASSTTYHFEYGTTTAYGTEVPVGGAKVSGYTQAQSVSQAISGLTAATSYHFRVVATSAGGTTYGADRTFSTAPKVYLGTFGSKGTTEGKFEGSWGAATALNGDVWVTDYSNDRIEEFSSTGKFIQECGSKGSGEGQLSGPTGIAVNPTSDAYRGGYIYVSDSGNNRIEVFSPECKVAETIGKPGSGSGGLSGPMGLTVSGLNILAVADSGNNRIEEFNWETDNAQHKAGEFIASYGSKGSGNGDFVTPTDIVSAGPGEFTDSARFYVVDSGNDRAQEFEERGSGYSEYKYIEQFGSKGSEVGELLSPTAIVVDPTTGDLDVTDTGNNRVEEFLPAGTYVAKFGTGGVGSEEFESPKGIAVSATGNLDVADYSNNRVGIWQSAHSQEPYVETEAATSAAEAGGTLNGIVNPEGLEAKYYFEYGTTTAYGSKTAEVGAGSGKGNLEVSKAITGLTASTTYHFRIVATNSKGTVDGSDQTFSTTGKPTVETETATGVVDTEAYLNGIVDPRGAEAKYYFEYGPTVAYGSKTAEVGASSGTGDLGEISVITGLTVSTTYHFRIVATNSHGTTDGADQVFTTADKPTVETSAATSASETEAILNGVVNPRGVETKYRFEYGPTTAYGSTTAEVSAGSGTGSLEESKTITGLTASTVYHFRVVATNSHGRSEGADQLFSTTGKPTVKTNAATSVVETEAILNGTVNPRGLETKYYYEYGLSVSYGSKTAEGSAGSGTKSLEASKAATALTGDTTYHFRIVATNSRGTVYGSDEMFSTPSKPFVETKPATGIGGTKATLNGNVNPRGTETKYYFEYGPTTSYGTKTAEVSVGSGTSSLEESKNITGLTESSTYHFRIVATNSHGTSDGSDEELKTLKKPSVETKTATGVTTTGATLKGAVNPNGTETKYYFEYGTTIAYGSKTAEASAGSGTSNVEESKAITGLEPSVPYHFRIVATSSGGTSDGEDNTFTTLTPSWRFTSTPNPSETVNAYLRRVSCTAPAACTSVGDYSVKGGSGTEKLLAERWNGKEWSLQSVPNPTGAETVYASSVSCSTSAVCMAVGYYSNSAGVYFSFTETWNGTEWKIQSTPEPTGVLNSLLSGVSCTSSTACTAVGWYENSSGVEVPWADRWNGTEWSVQSVPAPTEAKGTYPSEVSCVSSTACTLVGSYENSSSAEVPFAENWNGTTWSVQSMPSPTGGTAIRMEGVSCTASTECTAVGYYKISSTQEPVAERWNGTEWKIQSLPEPSETSSNYAGGVSCVSSTACTLSGLSYNTKSKKDVTLAERWNGTEWTIQSTPNDEKGEGLLIGGVSCSTLASCAAVGNSPKYTFAEIYE